MLNYIFHYIKSLFVEGFCFLSCLILKRVIIKHTWKHYSRYDAIRHKRKKTVVVDLRKAPDKLIDKYAVHIPYHKQLNWNTLLQSLAHRNEHNYYWILVLHSNKKTALKTLEAELKKGCKIKRSKLRYPSEVHYSFDDLDIDVILSEVVSVAKKSNIQL